ncbi:NAD-dependent epimerase/dehydratase family protein [Massilia sp. CF038]|uniref:NAD-dependent epimerase/dehydratase family protein n=1 Tax=Massilia sp. CF038 TaxID=1881045 RepID=UPI00091D1BFD|nr:NAD-dependent epimerase/dehydratase family protein [Massilia sp. CF038]SHH51698.1 Nucleoside-diphosphate-sugar epimerase [Massilia sp. CF038]
MSGTASERFAALELNGEGQGKRALITGVRGFTGRYLEQELRQAGYRVFGTILPGEEPGPDLFEVDLCDRDATAAMIAQVQPDVVAHLAAISFVGHANIEQIYRVNVIASRNLLEALAAQAHQPGCVLLASSGNIYGNASSGMLDEQVAPVPTNDYAVSKLAMEYMARLWSSKLPIVIVRPFNYTGVGQEANFLLPKIVSHFRQAAPEIELGNLAIARDFSDVRVVAACYRRLLHVSPAGQTFNVCSGQAHSLASVIDTMGAIAGYQIKVHSNPAFMRKDDVITLVGNNAKLSSVIGAIAPTPLADTLRWMYEA